MIELPQQIVGAASTGDWLNVLSPFDESVVGRVEKTDAAGVELAISRAHALFRNRKEWLDSPRRIDIIRKMALLMEENRDMLIAAAISEGGKPYRDTQVELDRAIDGVRNCAECIRSDSGREIPMGMTPSSLNRLAMTSREPIGVVLAFSAFNHPLNLIVHQVGPAVAAGCPVIVKPAQDTPLSAFLLTQLLHRAGLPEAWCQCLVPDSRELSTKMAADKRIGFFSFIGSADVGWMLRSKLAPGVRCALEHGGVAPLLVAADADLDLAVPGILKGGFYHAGQVCVSVQRVYVCREQSAQLVARLKAETAKLVTGDPASKDTDVGPLIRSKETDRLTSWVAEAVAEGAELISGGSPLSASCFAPTLLLNPSLDSKVSKLEVFGPVICIYEVDGIEQALEWANSLPAAFQGAVYTQSVDTAMHVYSELDAAAVMVNDHTAFRVDWMPFAGLRESGLGVGGIPYTYAEMQIEKMLVIQSAHI